MTDIINHTPQPETAGGPAIYHYDAFDAAMVRERVAQFRTQVARRQDGSLTEDEFKPLRLMNGVYLQLHAYMLRIAIPYGTLSSTQMRVLAEIGERWDRGYGHFTTRQNIQFNWPKLRDIPDILDRLADVEMHAIQTSGNCIRNVTSDPFAGAAADEIDDPRPTAELLRQWSTAHPEFSFLPRKFKIAITGSPNDRAATGVHDIGLRMARNEAGEAGYEVLVGGGLGRSPRLARQLSPFVPQHHLLGYLEAVMRVYNLHGRRDNKYKARIKILVDALGIDGFREQVEADYARMDPATVDASMEELARIQAHFQPPPARGAVKPMKAPATAAYAQWLATNITPHARDSYAIVTVSLKPPGGVPGDATSAQMRALADVADVYSDRELRITHTQNVVLPWVHRDDLPAVYAALAAQGLATANLNLITDIIACPGMDYCALATARSIPVAQAISQRFSDPDRQAEIGPLSVKISGCINACGHHHVGAIGILGLNKAGEENYQITLGGDPTERTQIGTLFGPGVPAEAVPEVLDRLVAQYLTVREPGEPFVDTVRRLGTAAFKEALHAPIN